MLFCISWSTHEDYQDSLAQSWLSQVISKQLNVDIFFVFLYNIFLTVTDGFLISY